MPEISISSHWFRCLLKMGLFLEVYFFRAITVFYKIDVVLFKVIGSNEETRLNWPHTLLQKGIKTIQRSAFTKSVGEYWKRQLSLYFGHWLWFAFKYSLVSFIWHLTSERSKFDWIWLLCNKYCIKQKIIKLNKKLTDVSKILLPLDGGGGTPVLLPFHY